MGKVTWRGDAKPNNPIYGMGRVVSGRKVKGETISQSDALAAARSHLASAGIERRDEFWLRAKVTNLKPPGMHQTWDEPAWYVRVPPAIDGSPWQGLRSSMVIVVSQSTGRVIAMGSAGDEGK